MIGFKFIQKPETTKGRVKPNTFSLIAFGLLGFAVSIYANASLKSDLLRTNKMLLKFHRSTQPTYILGFYFQIHE